MMECWVLKACKELRRTVNYDNITNNALRRFCFTHFSSIPIFHHSNCEKKTDM